MIQEWLGSIMLAKQGDLTAFNLVVREFQDMAVGYAYTILRDFQMAEDAAQEAFIEAYFSLKSLQEPKAFPAWFRKIVFRQCSRLTRSKQPQLISLENAVELSDPGPTPLEVATSGETMDRVLSTIDTLNEQERTITTLYCINGYSLAEVGDFLEVPVSTVKNRLHSARKQLRERMMELVEETLKQHAPGDNFSKKVARVLDGIERTHWETTGALCFTGSVLACMHYLGEPMTWDYVMGISGGAFALYWHPEWSPANCDLLLYGEEPVKRTFHSLGYNYTYMPDYFRKTPVQTKEFYQKHIVESIDEEKPVLAIGIVGPPECCVIAGYDRDGEVVYGRSYFQGSPFGGDNYEQETTGYYRTDKWYDNFYGMIRIGSKKDTPSRREIIQNTLEWAIRLAREPEFTSPTLAFWEGCHLTHRKHFSGLAAYDAIISALKRKEVFPEDNLEILAFRCIVLGSDGIRLLSWKRYSAMLFLNNMVTDDLPGADNLRKAAEFYGKEAELVRNNYGLIPDFHSPDDKKKQIADLLLRNQIVDLMQELKLNEEQAVHHLELAYKALTE